MRSSTGALLEIEDEQTFWSEYGEVYEQVLTRFSAYRELRDRIAGTQPPGRRVLDVGCGPGTISEALARRGCRVLGIDYNPAMVRLASRKAREGLEFRRMDAAALEFPDAVFDGVVSNNVLYFVPDPVAVLSEIYRVLAPGGVFTLSAPRAGFDMRVLDRRLARDVEGSSEKALLEAHAAFLAHNRALDTGGMRNLFEPEELVRILVSEIGFSRAIRQELAYLDQNYFLVLAK